LFNVFTSCIKDPLEVETADKMVLVALNDGTVHGIHLGTKKEVNWLLCNTSKGKITIAVISYLKHKLLVLV
jgi:proteasomal ATPase-associated factor 1